PLGAGPDAGLAALELAAGADPVEKERRLSVAAQHLDWRRASGRLESDESATCIGREGAPKGPRRAAGGALEEPGATVRADVRPRRVGGPDDLLPGVPVGLLVHGEIRIQRNERLRGRTDEGPVEDAVLRSTLAGGEEQQRSRGGQHV